MVRGLTLALAGLACAVAAGAGPTEPLAEATARLDRAEAALAAAHAAPDRIAALGAALAEQEAALAELRAGLDAAAAAERESALALAARREEIARLLAVLQAVDRSPPPAQALHPQGPLGAARAAAMLARLRPALAARAAELADTLAARAEARERRGAAGAELAAGLRALRAAQADLRREIAATPPAAPEPDPGIAAMARASDTLTALAAALAAPEPEAAAGEPRPLAWPVAGTLLRGFQDADSAGVRRPGIVMSAPPQSLVAAPADAAVRYAGPFLDYGYVVVLELEPGTMVVLAGLAQLRVRTGERVRRGALLGLLGGRALDVEEYVMLADAGTGAGAGETLYIEIRHKRGPVDPEPWFAGRNG